MALTISQLNRAVLLLSAIGIVLCIYTYVVETKKEEDSSYEAMCDINEHISCTKVFTSEYGKGFGLVKLIAGEDSIFNVPNPVYGLIMYSTIFMFSLSPMNLTFSLIQVCQCILANVGSIYLGCILYFVLRDFCIVCVTTYVVNFILLICCTQKYNLVKSSSKSKKNKKVK
ncbi:vitamin K epoxide reductase complex subunit 1-like protein 1 [Neocloeon triangulifer]|uniref:vitamin K epoxide reductase complex subunit 1-like protein 1 n=1 Tax=Neocloeon triangulifer TaxID=2078957 RepID=UPI00286F16E4|nr:vitamin K epoxide reductase complex subunit 1-like protein 1 [Neocloeon triangulifer]XP_059482689.1 vitamin K epoxide reductase complex subunit 1-like protein 1 [Neocloeon triangulifer]